MKVKDCRKALEQGGKFNLTIRPIMGMKMVLENVSIRRGPQYVKKDGSFTIRAGMPGHKQSVKVKVHEITDIVPR